MAVPDITAEITAFREAAYGEDVRDALIQLAQKLRGVITSELETMASTWNTYKNEMASTWNTYKNEMASTWNTYKNEMASTWNTYKNGLESDVSDLTQTVNVAVNTVNEAVNTITEYDTHFTNVLDYYRIFSKNYFDKSNLKKNATINSSGVIINSSDEGPCSTINFIKVTPSATYKIYQKNILTSLLVIAFYSTNSANSFINRVTNSNNFAVPATANYIRVSTKPVQKDSIDELQILLSTDTIFDFKKVFNTYKLKNIDLPAELITDGLLFNKINNFTNELLFNLIDIGEIKDNYYITTSNTEDSANGQAYITAKVYPGEIVYYTGHMLGSSRYYGMMFYDENDDFIGYSEELDRSTSTQVIHINKPIKIPDNVVKIRANGYRFVSNNIRYQFSIKAFRKNFNSFAGTTGFNNCGFINTDWAHIVCYGQSLSNGSDSLYVADKSENNTYMLSSITGTSGVITDMLLNSNQQHPVVSATNVLSNLFNYSIGQNVNFIAGSYGTGGQSIAQLMSSTRQVQIKEEESYNYDISTQNKWSDFIAALSSIKSVIDNRHETVSCPIIFYLQGERDYYSDESLSDQPGSVVAAYACGGDKDKYKLYMSRLKEDMQNACMTTYNQTYKPYFAIYQVSGNFVKNKQMTINMAQIEFAEENEDVILLPSPYFVPHYSSSHLTTNGYRWFGEYLGKIAYNALYKHEIFEPVKECGFIVDGSNIRIKIANAILPLIIDTWTVEEATGYGFTVYVNDSIASINDVILYGDEIILTLDSDISTANKIEISYAGQEVHGIGNIRDSATYSAKYNYWDDSSDKGSSNNLTISHIPTDKTGNNIRGKKYPMHNWMRSFYKRIK